MWYGAKNLMRGTLVLTAMLAGAMAVSAQGIGFRNDLPSAVIVQGATKSGMAVRIGAPFLIQPGKVGWDNKLPPGIRFINIRDAAQPNVFLIRDFQVKFDGRNDLALIITMDGPKIILKPYIPGAP